MYTITTYLFRCTSCSGLNSETSLKLCSKYKNYIKKRHTKLFERFLLRESQLLIFLIGLEFILFSHLIGYLDLYLFSFYIFEDDQSEILKIKTPTLALLLAIYWGIFTPTFHTRLNFLDVVGCDNPSRLRHVCPRGYGRRLYS